MDHRPHGSFFRQALRRRVPLAAVSIMLLWAGASHAGPADVVAATADCRGSVCSFAVTVRHADTGWDHYANAWQVLLDDGTVLATRVLQHPHVNEQPFTRELDGVRVPPGVSSVRIRARDSVHGYGGGEVEVSLEERGERADAPQAGDRQR